MMYNIFVLLSILALVRGEDTGSSQEVGVAATQIINGRNAKSGERPFQVSMQKQDGFHFCGGSIVTQEWVVTAAHCTVDQKKEDMKLVVGTNEYMKPGQTSQVSQIIVHKQYNPSDSYRNDISLVKAASPFTYSDLVKAVRLPQLHATVPGGRVATLSGWGLKHIGESQARMLQVVDITVTDQEECKRAIQSRGLGQTVYPTNICANNPEYRQGQCSGDSGGPLTVDGELAGIVSWSYKDPDCGSTVYPGIFTRASEYVDWIGDNMQNEATSGNGNNKSFLQRIIEFIFGR